MAEETQKMQDTQKEKPFQNREQVLQTAEKPQESKDVELDDEETERTGHPDTPIRVAGVNHRAG